MLRAIEDDDSDYINASFMCGVGGAKEFIVTQHPLESTRADFWRMAIEKDVTTIVMLGPLDDSSVRRASYTHTLHLGKFILYK